VRVGLIHATTHKDQRTRTERFRVRELRQAGWYSHASETEEEAPAKAEAEQAKGLVFSLSAPLAFRSLPLLALPCKPIPRQASSGNLRADMREAFRITQLASVVTKTLFVQITKQVERFHADIGAVKLALHQAPEVFHSIRMNIAANVLYGVIHDRVLIFPIQPVVRLQRIAEQRRASLDVLANLAVKFMLAAIRYSERSHVPAALHHSKRDGFIRATSARYDLGAAFGVHVAGLPADERFVHFNFTRKFRSGLVLHRFTNAMEHEPSGFLSQSKVTCDFAGTNTIPAVGNQPHSGEPFFNRDRGFIQNRPNLHRELFAAIRSATLPNAARLQEHRFLRGAVGALNPVGPTLRREVTQRIVGIAEVFDRIGQCLRGFHVQSMS